jgi:head-tail adaptor
MKIPGPKTVLSLQSVTEVAGAYGTTSTWATEGTISGVLTKHAGVRLSYKETERADKVTVISTLTFFCDIPTLTVTEKKRFTLGSRIFNILNVYNPSNCNHHLEIELQETV